MSPLVRSLASNACSQAVGKHPDTHPDRQADRQAGRQAGRQADRQKRIGRQMAGQADKQTQCRILSLAVSHVDASMHPKAPQLEGPTQLPALLVGLDRLHNISKTIDNGDKDNRMHTCMLVRSWSMVWLPPCQQFCSLSAACRALSIAPASTSKTETHTHIMGVLKLWRAWGSPHALHGGFPAPLGTGA